MGEIGNKQEFKSIQQLKDKMLVQFADTIDEDQFIVSLGTSQDYEGAITIGGST